MSVWWSVGLSACSLGSAWLIGNRRHVGWLVGLLIQVPWTVYAIATEQWGFLASCFVFTFVNARNWLKWRRDERQHRESQPGLDDRAVRVWDGGSHLHTEPARYPVRQAGHGPAGDHVV